MTRYRATLAYDGSNFYGYQIQPHMRTVQGVVEAAITQVLHEQTRIAGAGRTDTGVHATGQVIAFDATWRHDEATLMRAINANLPEDVALQSIEAQPDFHPRFDALSRTYRYHVAVVDVRQPLLAKRAWQIQHELDETRLERTAALLIGEHDFAAFGNPPQGDNTVRTVFRSAWHTESLHTGRLVVYEVEATAFLHHMVRRLVGLQVAVAQGLLSLAAFTEIFHSAKLSRNRWIAPPQGLTLIAVSYPPPGISRQDYYKAQGQSMDGPLQSVKGERL